MRELCEAAKAQVRGIVSCGTVRSHSSQGSFLRLQMALMVRKYLAAARPSDVSSTRPRKNILSVEQTGTIF
jgi:hypothetical protein